MGLLSNDQHGRRLAVGRVHRSCPPQTQLIGGSSIACGRMYFPVGVARRFGEYSGLTFCHSTIV
jgi:hypothetical protein